MNLLPPSVAVCRNPLEGLKPADRLSVQLGTRIKDLEPAPNHGGLIVCRFNGAWLLREQWDITLLVGDQLEWYEYPQGREGLRLLLQVALIASLFIPAAAFLTPYLAAANFAYNVLVPPRGPTLPGQLAPASGVFSTSLAGNAARLDQPIWRNMGRVKITPPFASQPYTEFLPSDLSNPTVDTDQFYYAIFALGVGEHDVEKAFIGKTPIEHFSDVLVAQYLGRGVQPTSARANVVTSDEVSTTIDLPEGRYSAAYTASRPGDTVLRIGIDIAASQGLGIGTDPLTAEWQVEAREVDDFGRPVGSWQVIGTESRTAATNTPQRWTNTYTLAAPIRPEVRVVRTNLKNTDPNARDGIQWIGMRAYLEKEATLNPDCSHFEVVMRASEQLSNFSQRDFSMIVRALVRTWHPDYGWLAESFTRNAMWWLADLWTNSIWGEGLPDERIDLQGLFDISLILDARQDRFDYSLTESRDSWDVAQLIAHSGRCRAFRKGGVYTVARDELVDVPVTAFSSRNTEPKSMVVHTSLPRREQPDGIVVEFQWNKTWDIATAECPCPGFSATDPASPFFDTDLPEMENPVYISLDGITGIFHATREGIYQAASMALRTATVSAKVEMEGVIVSFMDPVRWQPQIRGYGQTGDVAFWDSATLIMGLTEPVDFSGEQPYLTIQRDDGSLTDPVPVLPGPTVYDVVLPEAPDFDGLQDAILNGERERPKYLLGSPTSGDEMVKISSISDGGKNGDAQLYDIEAVIDDDRVHLADNSLLPGPGELQDPIDDGTDYDDGDGTIAIARMTDHYSEFTFLPFLYPTISYAGTFTLTNTGAFNWATSLNGASYGSGSYAHEWMAFPAEPAQIAEFEVFASLDGGSIEFLYPGAITGTFGSWLPMTADHTWGIDGATVALEQADANITLSIRRIASPDIIQATSVVSFHFGPTGVPE